MSAAKYIGIRGVAANFHVALSALTSLPIWVLFEIASQWPGVVTVKAKVALRDG